MPADQRGQPYRTARGWGVRYYDADGKRCRASGFPTRSAALAHYRDIIRPGIARTRRVGVDLDPRRLTLAALSESFLEAHSVRVEPTTIRTLREHLKRALDAFGDVPLADLEHQAPRIAAWTTTLPPGARYQYAAALRQVLDAAVSWGVIDTNPAKRAGRNPRPKRAEIRPLARAEVAALAVELGAWGPLVAFAAETGLRPAEWIALEWRDIDRAARVALIERSYAKGRLRAYGKTLRSRRRVPLTTAALAGLDASPRRIDTPLVFPAIEGGHIDLANWRRREWRPAVDAAGIAPCVPYVLRHTFASNALAAGIGLFELSRLMGTSIRMLDTVYGHLVVGSEAAVLAKLDAHAEAFGP
jgi:integrase